MNPLSADAAEGIELSFGRTPTVSDCGGWIEFGLKVKNVSGHPLDGAAPNPLMISAFLRDPNEDGPAVGDFPRLSHRLEVGVGEERVFDLQIPAPSEVGRHRLIVTLVQEGVMWLHLLPKPVMASAEIVSPGLLPWWTAETQDQVTFGSAPELNQARLKKFLSCGDQQRPLMLHLETVNICNLKCVICPYDQMSRAKETMSSALFQKIVDDYVAMGGGDVIITPTVGDVFLDKKLVERIRILNETPGIGAFGFVTNGGNAGVLSDDDLSFVVNSCKRIQISVYGLDEEETDAMTRRPGKHAQIEKQIQRIVRLNHSCVFGFGFRLLKPDAENRARTWMLEKLGRIYPHEVLTEFGNWGGAMDMGAPLPLGGVWAEPGGASGATGKPCVYPVVHLKVNVDGDVKFCSCVDYDSIEENTIGNAKNESLLSIYNGFENRRRWRDGISICHGCTHYKSPAVLGEFAAHLHSPIAALGV